MIAFVRLVLVLIGTLMLLAFAATSGAMLAVNLLGGGR